MVVDTVLPMGGAEAVQEADEEEDAGNADYDGGDEADAYDGDAGVVVDTVLPMGVQRLSRRLLMRRLAMLSMMLMLLLLMVMKMMWMIVMVVMMMMCG